jgi:hypothetical protein
VIGGQLMTGHVVLPDSTGPSPLLLPATAINTVGIPSPENKMFQHISYFYNEKSQHISYFYNSPNIIISNLYNDGCNYYYKHAIFLIFV